jgi:hypothetical protein
MKKKRNIPFVRGIPITVETRISANDKAINDNQKAINPKHT